MALFTYSAFSQVLVDEPSVEVGVHLQDQNSTFSGVNIGYQTGNSVIRTFFGVSLQNDPNEKYLFTTNLAIKAYSYKSIHIVPDASFWISEDYNGAANTK